MRDHIAFVYGFNLMYASPSMEPRLLAETTR